ncbi:MAG: glycoside hydrolase [Nitrospirota bacterium]
MSDRSIYIAFFWHMHQPFYKNPITGEYSLPWVRLHGIKDYYDMVSILKDFPDIHQTFNLVPSLIEQINDYVDNNKSDTFLDISAKPASELTPDDKVFLLKNFFMANFDNMIRPYPKYHELLTKRGDSVDKKDLERVSKNYDTQDYLDLQVLFNLTWFDPIFKENDPFLKELIQKEREFTEEEKDILLKKQMEVLSLIIPEYRSLASTGRVELTTSPYYHPILPLLCDSNSAREAIPDITLPKRRFNYPQDALSQIKNGISLHKRVFGHLPEGMWPSEGSVSEDIIPLLIEAGIRWIGTDEEILAESLRYSLQGEDNIMTQERLYTPYSVERNGKAISIIFRDKRLSDLIGFVYSKWDHYRAVDDFIERIHRIRENLSCSPKNHLISIILDGENAWEYYKNDGRDFFLYLYKRLSEDPLIRTVTIGEYLRENPPEEKLKRLFAGSWIGHNFRIWIGHEEDNTAWDLLSEARDALIEYEAVSDKENADKVASAWEEIYIAEGSDWCWWYGDDHTTELRDEFDEIYRSHLVNVYKLIGKEPPSRLMIPILRKKKVLRPTLEQAGYIAPDIDGKVTSYFEWLSAGFYDITKSGTAMHQASRILSHFYYGFDSTNIYLRIDIFKDIKENDISGLVFKLHFLQIDSNNYRLDIRIFPDKKENNVKSTMFEEREGEWKEIEINSLIAAEDIIEASIPFAAIGVKSNDKILFFISVMDKDTEVERWPQNGAITIKNLPKDFDTMWYV